MTGSPALFGDPEDRVYAEHQTAGEEGGAGQVGTGGETDPLAIGHQPDREQGGRKPDRDVDEEDPVPVDRFRQYAAEQQPDRAAGDGDEGVDADRLGLLTGLANIVTIMPRITADVSAPPTPWMKRATIRTP
jgi:hypothetical protein